MEMKKKRWKKKSRAKLVMIMTTVLTDGSTENIISFDHIKITYRVG
jgi:hypothetical protein